MEPLRLNEAGFITEYLVNGPAEIDFTDTTVDPDQLHYEKYLRSIVAKQLAAPPAGAITIGAIGRTGNPWRYYDGQGNWFVDYSTFYSSLKKVDLDAAAILVSQREQTVRAVLWTYAAVCVWCNGKVAGVVDTPVYKPITGMEMVLELHPGINLLYCALQNLGVRDTRTLFGIQIPDAPPDITVSLPDMDHAQVFVHCAQWLAGVRLDGREVVFPSAAPTGTRLGIDSMSPDYADYKTRISFTDVSGRPSVTVAAGNPELVISCLVGGQQLSRNLEIAEEMRPSYGHIDSVTENEKRVYSVIAGVQSLNRGGKYGFAIGNILARKALGQERPDDRASFLNNLELVSHRYDCSDFLVSGIIRYLHKYELDDELKQRTKDVLLNYRYWMTQKGSDAMCFWSENHSLLFYSNAMFAGTLYPDDYFPRAGMSGTDLYRFGRNLTEQWISDVETHGFEEFLSTVYMCVTFAGLLNVIDFADSDLSERTRKITDRLLRMLSVHTFRGVIIAPMGRVYRDIIYPFQQGAQALMNLANPDVPDSYGEGWVAWYATSSYRFPSGLADLMNAETSTEYATGNALIRLEKKADYCLTSVQSPREDPGFRRWKNLTLEPVERQRSVTHAYTKSLNERFHGTTCFEPGVYGYQQHMWSAALSADVEIFTNHPGGTIDSSSMRPGYWFGNGVMPAVKQTGNCIGIVYVIPKEHPIHFTHLLWMERKFDRTLHSGGWLFGQKGKGYIAVWCSRETTAHNDQLFNCEYRAYGDAMAWWCVCGSASESESFDSFCRTCREQTPVFSESTYTLSVPDRHFCLTFRKHADTTQFV